MKNRSLQVLMSYEGKANQALSEYYSQLDRAIETGDEFDILDAKVRNKQVKAYNSAIRTINKQLKQEYNDLLNKIK